MLIRITIDVETAEPGIPSFEQLEDLCDAVMERTEGATRTEMTGLTLESAFVVRAEVQPLIPPCVMRELGYR